MATNTALKNTINLKGSVDVVCEFFNYAINSIIYQRGLYPSDRFIQTNKYGLTLLMTIDDKLKNYLSVILCQLEKFLMKKNVHRIVLVIVDVDSRQTVERWQFKVDCDKTSDANESRTVDMRAIQNGIRDVIRQITASVTFLPLLEGKFSFDILLYTDKDTEFPSEEWSESNPHFIENAESVQLRSFSTAIHKVNAVVEYRNVE